MREVLKLKYKSVEMMTLIIKGTECEIRVGWSMVWDNHKLGANRLHRR